MPSKLFRIRFLEKLVGGISEAPYTIITRCRSFAIEPSCPGRWVGELNNPRPGEKGLMEREESKMENEKLKSQQVIVTSTKSVGISVLLTLILGPIGMFYSTAKGALTWLLLVIVLSVLALAINPFLIILVVPVMWVVSIIWGVKAVKAYNEKLLEQT